MTHKPNQAGMIELKFNDLPENENKKEGNESFMPPLTHNGHDLRKEVEEAIAEKDIILLRQQLQTITKDIPSKETKPDGFFNLAENMDYLEFLENYPSGTLNVEIPAESLPKIHLHQHLRNSFENSHQFYEVQHKESENVAVIDPEVETEESWHEIEDALREKDIMSLRESLSHIYTCTDTSFYALEDIENYRDGRMNPDEVVRFEEELTGNSELKASLQLDSELQEAVGEVDVMKLRESLGRILQNNNSTSKTIKEIESFLDGELNEEARTSFIEELLENDGLRKEIRMVQEINTALSEKSVIQLRDNLHRISGEVYQLQEKSVFSLKKGTATRKKAAIVAAVVVITFGVSAFLQNSGNSDRKTYDRFYTIPESVTTYRSYPSNIKNDLNSGFEYYQKKDYTTALTYFLRVIESDTSYPAAQFYSGASYQNLEQFQKAIPHYDKVIKHNNNLFLEQATWYSALCQVGIGDKSSAISKLKEIVKRNGFYSNDATLLLRKLQ
jgi:tetratricopeptide (TPR) repeat protein